VKKLFFTLIFVIGFSVFGSVIDASAQTKCAVLPFKNAYGDMKMNIWSYRLQDSLLQALSVLDPEGKNFTFIPIDEIEDELAQLNMDPSNPQYETDMWNAVVGLGAELVVMGDFNFKNERFLINAYVVDVKTKLRNQKRQARNIFKKEKDIMKSVPIIVKKLKKIFVK
jgi:TolB-like protein